jgi:hypothetical protein
MFARGVFSFHPVRFHAYPENLPSPIIPTLARPSRKSNYSRTYGMSLGGGCTGFLVRPIRLVSNPFVSPPYQISVRNSFVSPTYAKTGGTHSPKNVGPPTFLIFPLIFRTFLPLMGPQQNRGKEEKSWPRKFGRGAKGALERPALVSTLGN